MMVKCPVCKGKGTCEALSESFKDKNGGELVYPIDCDYCGGEGMVEKAATFTERRTE